MTANRRAGFALLERFADAQNRNQPGRLGRLELRRNLPLVSPYSVRRSE